MCFALLASSHDFLLSPQVLFSWSDKENLAVLGKSAGSPTVTMADKPPDVNTAPAAVDLTDDIPMKPPQEAQM